MEPERLRQRSCLPCLSRLFSFSYLSVQPRALLVKECQGDRGVRERIGATKKTLTFAFSSSTGAEHRRSSSLVCSGVIVGVHLWLWGYLFSYLFVSDGGVRGGVEKEAVSAVTWVFPCSLYLSTPCLLSSSFQALILIYSNRSKTWIVIDNGNGTW